VLWHFIQQFGLGALAGIGGGKLLVWLINRVNLASGLYPLLAMAGGLAVYAGTTVLDGSGFLAIYLAGLILGNSRVHTAGNILRVHDGLAWLSQIVLFLMLGLLVTPGALIEIGLGALGVAGLLDVRRAAIAVGVSLLPFKFPLREQAFISWTACVARCDRARPVSGPGRAAAIVDLLQCRFLCGAGVAAGAG